ncbi:MAG TPA: ATP-grasp domain-containing protein [Gemmatimonadaceae bacterium]|nr:ATP-grasp domain-containing protein [Gemmatimonadaceae bacterium]
MPRATVSASRDPSRSRKTGRPAEGVVVAGFSTRGLVESAMRAGYAVASVDAFADLDNGATPALALRAPGPAVGRCDPLGLARATAAVPGEWVAYVASFENHPDAVRVLARGRRLLGNPPNVLARARAPSVVAALLRKHGFAAPELRLRVGRDSGRTTWLAKPFASGGGHGITRWRHGDALRRTHFLQQHIAGQPGSLVFVADGLRAVPFAFSRQLVGEAEFGASGFGYCGSVLVPAQSATFANGRALFEAASAIADTLTRELRLVGVNGIDFIARSGTPFVTEVNPRYTASMELAERAFGFSVFGAHVRGCDGVSTRFDLDSARRDSAAQAFGKAIVFAKRTVVVGDTRAWLDDPSVRDVPHPGERIPRGSPVCTIFARGRSDTACHAALVRRARKLYHAIGGSGRRSA